MSGDIVSTLEQSELFNGFDRNQLSQVVAHLQPEPVSLKDRDYLYKRGDPALCCWEILSGGFLVRRASLREPFRHVDYHIGAVTGLLGLVEPGSHRPISLIADGNVELMEIPAMGISKLDPNTKIALLNNISHILIKKLFNCRAVLNSWDV